MWGRTGLGRIQCPNLTQAWKAFTQKNITFAQTFDKIFCSVSFIHQEVYFTGEQLLLWFFHRKRIKLSRFCCVRISLKSAPDILYTSASSLYSSYPHHNHTIIIIIPSSSSYHHHHHTIITIIPSSPFFHSIIINISTPVFESDLFGGFRKTNIPTGILLLIYLH